MPGQAVARADAEVVNEEQRHQEGEEQRVGEPAQQGGRNHPEQAQGPRGLVVADEQAGLGQDQERRQQQVDVAGLQGVAAGLAPPDQQAQQAGEAGGQPAEADAAGGGEQQPGPRGAQGREPDLVGRGAVAPPREGEDHLGGVAAAVKDRGFGVAGVESRVVAGQGAALVQRAGAQVAVVEVQGVPAGQDRPVVEEPVERPVGAEQAEGQPALPGEQAQQAEQPGGVVAGLPWRGCPDPSWIRGSHGC